MKQIVLARDFSECAGKAQDYAAFLTRTYEADLSVIHVPESPLWYGSNAATILYLEQAQKEGERRLADTAQQLRQEGLTSVEVRQVVGRPPQPSRIIISEIRG